MTQSPAHRADATLDSKVKDVARGIAQRSGEAPTGRHRKEA